MMMRDPQLTTAALNELKRLANEVGTPSIDAPEFQILWDELLVMGDHKRCHITSRGKALLGRLGELS